MPQLSAEQEALKASIQKSASIWGGVFGLVAAGIAYWLLGGQSGVVRIGVAVVIGVAAVVGIRAWRIKANSSAATCGKCSATFSIIRNDRNEKILSSELKETREAQPDHSTKVTTWIEEIVEVTDTYTCTKCADSTTKISKRTVKKDEKETVEPAPKKAKPAASKAKPATKAKPAAKKAKPAAAKAKSAPAKSGKKAATTPAAKAKKAGPKSSKSTKSD